MEDDYRLDKKRLDDASLEYKRQLLSTNDQLKTAQDQVSRLQRTTDQLAEEKRALEDKVKRENLILMRQLNELKEQSERDLREKNESILRLNNILNENLEKQSAEQVVEMQSLRDQVERKEKELLKQNKELQEITLVLSKRDKEISQLKKEVEAVQTTAEIDV